MIMPSNVSKQFEKDSIGVLSMEEYRAIIEEDFSSNKKYSDTGYLHPEKNASVPKWFKGSRNRGFRGKLVA